MRKSYDIVIMGVGSIGLTADSLAKQLRVMVALLKNDRIGGDCS